MKKEWNIIAGTLAIIIVTAAISFAVPESAHADIASCIAGVIAGKAYGKAEATGSQLTATGMTKEAAGTLSVSSAAGSVTSVPVYDAYVQQSIIQMSQASADAINTVAAANARVNADTAGQTQGLTIQRCIVQPLVVILARSLLSTFTAQMVNWINNGFHGSPLFVTNPQGFMADVADQTMGQFIANLGPIGAMLCSPFDLQLRLSLNLAYGNNGYWQEIGCRLTDIEQNVQRAFTTGAWGTDGWDNWLQLTAVPQDNPYGAYIAATNALDARIGNAQFSLGQQLNWGHGFLSWTDSKTGQIQTPGIVIENQLANTLGEPVRQVGVAQDLDAILGALVNQMINQVMGGVGGLLGASGQPSGGGSSMVDQGLASTPDSIISQNTAAQTFPSELDVETGVNTDGSPVYIGPTLDPASKAADPAYFCSAFRNNSYSADGGSSGNNVADTSDVYVTKICQTADNHDGTFSKGTCTDSTFTPIKTQKIINSSSGIGAPAATSWTVSDYNAASTFCQNSSFTVPTSNAISAFQDQVDNFNNIPTTTTAPNTGPVPDTNVAVMKTAAQSSTYVTNATGNTTADRAVDGNARQLGYTQTGVSGPGVGACVVYGANQCAAETGRSDSGGAWWNVDLGGEYNIHGIEIDQPFGAGWNSYLSIAQRGSEVRVRAGDTVDASGKVIGGSILPADSTCTSSKEKTANPNYTFCDDNNGNTRLSRTGLTLTGRYLQIEKDPGSGGLALAQVKVMGSRVTAGTGNSSAPASPFTTSPGDLDYTSVACPVSGGVGFPCVSNGSAGLYDITFAANQTENGIEARLSIVKTDGGVVGITSIFKNLSLTEKVDSQNPATYAVNLAGTVNGTPPLVLFTDSAGQNIGTAYELSVAGNIAVNAAPGSYKLTIDLLDSTGKVVTTQNTLFKIQ